MFTEVSNYVTSLEANTAFQSDIAALSTDLPASVIQEAENNPDALFNELAAANTEPAWASAIPTPVIDSLATLIAQPLEAAADVDDYVASLLDKPEASSVLSVLATAIPTSAQNAFASDPISFLDNLITASALPSWASEIPAPLQSDLGSVINQALTIIDSDFESPAPIPTGPPPSYYPSGGYPPPSSFYPTVVIEKPTGTGTGVAVNGKPTGSPIAFQGGAAPMRTAAAGAAALMVGAGIFANF